MFSLPFKSSLQVIVDISSLVCQFITASPCLRMTNCPWNWRAQVTWTIYIMVGTNHFSGAAAATVITLCTQVGYIKSQHISSLKRGVVRVTWLILHFAAPNDISGTAEARVVKFCLQVDYRVLAFGWQTTPEMGVVRVTWHIFNFVAIISLERFKRESPNFVHR